MALTRPWNALAVSALPVIGALAFASGSRGACCNTSIAPDTSIGGVSLGTSQVELERFLGSRGAHSPTRSTDVKGALDKTYGHLRVTFVPCSAGHCIAAVATSSPAFRTPNGIHVQSSLSKLRAAYPGIRCGGLPKSSDVSRPDGYCKLGFSSGQSGTTFLTIRDLTSRVREVKTIAVAQPSTLWNINPALGVLGPSHVGSSSTRDVLILVAILAVLAVPLARLIWFFNSGGQLVSGGSDGAQVLGRNKRRHNRLAKQPEKRAK
jgi:hypothetical protein